MGFQEILIIAVVILVLFGARRIPEMMKGVGKGIRDFNNEKNKALDNEEDAADEVVKRKSTDK